MMEVDKSLQTEEPPVDSLTTRLPESNPPLTEVRQFKNPFQKLHLAARWAKRLALILLTLSGVASDSKPVLSQNIGNNTSKTGENNLVLENTPPSEKTFQNLPAYPPTNVEQTRQPEAVTVLSNYSVEGFSASGNQDVYGLVTDKTTGKQYAVGIGIDPATKSVYFERYTELESSIKGESFLVAENNPKIAVITGKDSNGKNIVLNTTDGWATKRSIEIGGTGTKALQISPDGKYFFLSKWNNDHTTSVVRVNLADGKPKEIPLSGVSNENYILSATKLTALGTDSYSGYGIIPGWRGYFKLELKPDVVLVTNLYPESGSSDPNLITFNDNQDRYILLINNHLQFGGAIFQNINDGTPIMIRPDLSQYKYPQGGAYIGTAFGDVTQGLVFMGTIQPGINGESDPNVETYSFRDLKARHNFMNKKGDWPSDASVINIYPKKANGEKFVIVVTETRNNTGDEFIITTLSQRITNGISSTEEWQKVTELIPAAGTAISSFKATIPVILNSTTGR